MEVALAIAGTLGVVVAVLLIIMTKAIRDLWYSTGFDAGWSAAERDARAAQAWERAVVLDWEAA